jgi:rhodanese-related sulfurtransferase
MTHSKIIVVAFVLMGIAVGPLRAVARDVPSIDSLELASLYVQEPSLMLLDFRNETDYADGHLPGAIHVPWGSNEEQEESRKRILSLLTAPPRPVILYGLNALILVEMARMVADENDGPVAIYPAGAEGWHRYEQGYLNVSWEGLWRMLTASRPVVIDLRDAQAFNGGHIPGAQLATIDQFKGKSLRGGRWAHLLTEERPVLVYCEGPACVNSHKIAERLSQLGVRRVYRFQGGYEEWLERTGPFVKHPETD